MPFIDRKEGVIVGAFACQQREGQEYIAEDAPELVAFYAEQESQADKMKAKAALVEIDIKSVRSIREWLVQQPDCPQYLKDHEALAVAEREKLNTKP